VWLFVEVEEESRLCGREGPGSRVEWVLGPPQPEMVGGKGEGPLHVEGVRGKLTLHFCQCYRHLRRSGKIVVKVMPFSPAGSLEVS